jgi:16S rRNA (guanine966-N2)-methyltransferase
MGEQRMRIVAGTWRGRRIAAPHGWTTRPTSDRVREALFDALTARLGGDLGGGPVLDLYAGTGAMGLEALSRGASRAVFVDNDREALRVLKSNVDSLGASDRSMIVAGDAAGPSLDRALCSGPFALLLLDPPYRIEPADVSGVLVRARGSLLADGMVAWEHAVVAHAAAPAGFELVKTYVYGETAVTLLRRADGTESG